ncbi:DUF4974 domain-containing protein [Chitinophaga sp. SYP-B3965]|uniref:FecR domain-containing protein n=1 Tax=Chitinophaga sp. SYP-B3965 TaxID=2663120 RepID=UPI001299609C|nr:FecR domain-containing protein [Chitinophaga sp. SYP-B3965]MRG44737.1 DUF4974 domain-containing protein [Chitinophaga sp. SYP-B3965]
MPHKEEELLQRYLEGKCTTEEVVTLIKWLQTTGSHRSLLKQMKEEFLRSMAAQPEISPVVSDRIEARLLQDISAVKIVRMRISRRWIAAAAILAFVVTTGTVLLVKKRPVTLAKKESPVDVAPGTNKAQLTLANGSTLTLDSVGNQVIKQGATVVHQKNGQLQYDTESNTAAVGYNILTVPRGGQFHVVLPDGSKVWLNAASSLKYPTAFTGNERLVELQGQGYFEVTKNAQHPFIVKVDDMTIKVLGTSFDVMAYKDEKAINTTLIEGAVKVNDQLLKPGQQASLDNANGCMYVYNADIQQVIAWKTGFFEFDNVKLADIMRQVSRWYDIDITYNNNIEPKLFGGRISRNLPLSEILHMLEANGAKFNMKGRSLVIE